MRPRANYYCMYGGCPSTSLRYAQDERPRIPYTEWKSALILPCARARAARGAAGSTSTRGRFAHGRAAVGVGSKDREHLFEFLAVTGWTRWCGRAHDKQLELVVTFLAVVFE